MTGRTHKLSKYQAQVGCAERTAKQFYNLNFAPTTRNRFKRMIEEGLVRKVRDEGERKICIVTYKGEEFRVVYDSAKFHVVAFLPR